MKLNVFFPMKLKFLLLETKVPSHETTMEPAGSYFYIISYSIMTQRLSLLIIGLIMNIGAFCPILSATL